MSALGERLARAASGHVMPPKSVPAAAAEAALAAAAGLPPWLVHWRLRAALSSQQLFTDLFVELGEAAAVCYSQCGHLRTAALLRADVADALVKAGSLQRAAGLYERQCRTFLRWGGKEALECLGCKRVLRLPCSFGHAVLTKESLPGAPMCYAVCPVPPTCREGWHALAAQTLPKLAACQLALGSAGLAHTATALLSLPAPFRGSAAERQAACQLLLQAAQLGDGLAGCRPLLPTGPTAGSGTAAAAAAAAAVEPLINASSIIAAAPPQASVSRFYGRTAAGGSPLLAPRPGGGGAVAGAVSAAVGDALAVQLYVDNQLPVALPLQEVVLTLAVLQEMTGESGLAD